MDPIRLEPATSDTGARGGRGMNLGPLLAYPGLGSRAFWPEWPKVGSYTLTITATSGGLVRSTTVSLQLKRK
jgi:hypothetical protein